MTDERPPGKSQQAAEELRKWAVEQSVEFTKRKPEYDSSRSVVDVAEVLYRYVINGRGSR